MEASRIKVVGNIKYDGPIVSTTIDDAARGRLDALRELASSRGISLDPERITLLGGSTHPGEEKWLAKIYLKLLQDFPELSLVVVPRHFERADQAVTDLLALGMNVVRRSQITGDEAPGIMPTRPTVLVVDTTGELNDWYRLSTIVFVGKSLGIEAVGGQNPVEPLSFRKAGALRASDGEFSGNCAEPSVGRGCGRSFRRGKYVHRVKSALCQSRAENSAR